MNCQADVTAWAERECAVLGRLVASRIEDVEDLKQFIEECRTDHILDELLVTRAWAYRVGLDYQGHELNQDMDAALQALRDHDVPMHSAVIGYMLALDWTNNIIRRFKTRTGEIEEGES